MPHIGHAASREPTPAARPEPATATDPFLLDGDRLRELASEAIVRRGLAYFKEGRVTDLGWSRDRPAGPDAPVWLHAELLPRGVVSQEQAATLHRSLALASAHEVPPQLVEEVLNDVRALVGELP